MPIINGPDFPIRREPVTGPGVDAFVNRREPGRLMPITTDELRENWLKTRDATREGLKSILKI